MTKKIILAGALLAFGVGTAQAQRVGIRGGVSLANQQQRFLGQNVENDQITQYHVGLTSELELSDNFVLRPELLFSRKGTDFSAVLPGVVTFNYKDKLSYLTLPVTLAFKADVGPGKLVLGAGPYAGLLLAGRREGSGTVLGFGGSGSGDLAIGNRESDDYKPLDAGVNFQAGYEFTDQIFFTANYGLGLVDVQSNGDDNNYRRNRTLELGLGFYLTQ